MGNTDYLLDSIITEIKNTNDSLSELKQLLIENARDSRRNSGGNRGSGSGGGSGGRGGSGGSGSGNGLSGLFNTLQGEMSSLTRFSLGNTATVENTVRTLGTSIGSVSKAMVGLGGPIGMVGAGFLKIAEVGLQVYEYLNQQLKMYNDLNSSGVTLANGMNSLRRGSSTAFMSVEEFSAAVKNNTQSMVVLEDQYGDGVVQFGNLVKSVQLAQNELGLYGLSQAQIADITAKNIKIQKLYSGAAHIREMNEAASTTKFITDLTYLSRAMGTSIEELISKTASTMEGADFGQIQSSLTSLQGIPAELASEMTKTMSTVFAGLGKGGDVLASSFADFVNVGYLMPEGMEAAANVMGRFNQELLSMNQQGLTSAEDYNRFTSQFFKDSANLAELEQARQVAIQMGNKDAATKIQNIINAGKLITAEADKPIAAWEELTNRFNNWMGESIMDPFNNFVNNTTESFGNYLLNLIDTSDGFWSGTWQFVKDSGSFIMNGVMDGMEQTADYLVGGVFKVVDFLFGTSTFETVNEYFDEAFNYLTDSMGSVVDWAGDLFFGIDDASDVAYEWITDKMDALYDVLGSSLDAAKGYWGKFTSWLGFGSDDEPVNANQAEKTQNEQVQNKERASKRAKEQSSTEKLKERAKVEPTAKPEGKPIEKIEEPKRPVVDPNMPRIDPMQDQHQKELISTLKKILNKSDEQSAFFNTLVGYMREISENTVPETNR